MPYGRRSRAGYYGAIANGIDSLGVLFGYGDREELESAGATYIAESVKDILKSVMI